MRDEEARGREERKRGNQKLTEEGAGEEGGVKGRQEGGEGEFKKLL